MRLLALGTLGVLLLLPGVGASADAGLGAAATDSSSGRATSGTRSQALGVTSDVAVTVTTGTTIHPPASFEVSGATAGETVSSGELSVAWLSNDAGMAIAAVSSDLVCADAACGAGSTPEVIAASAVSLATAAGSGTLDTGQVVATIVGDTGETQEVGSFRVQLLLPAVRPGRYVGTLRFVVIDPAAHGPGALRVSAGADGADAETSYSVTVRG